MKITDKSGLRDVRKENQAAAPKNNAGLFSLFASEIRSRQVQTDQYAKDVAELRTALEDAGTLLEQEPTIQNFKRFREILGKIAKQVSTEAYRLEKIGGTPMNPRYYEIITVIDKEADKLYELIVKEQKDRMAITASVIGIKGLIVDLVT